MGCILPLSDGQSNFQTGGQTQNGFPHFRNLQVPSDFLINIIKACFQTDKAHNFHASQLHSKQISCALHILISKLDVEKLIFNIDVTSFSLTFNFPRILQNANQLACIKTTFKTNIYKTDCYAEYPISVSK